MPAAGLRIKAEFAYSEYTTTDEFGEYSFDSLVPGSSYDLVTNPVDYNESRVFAKAVQLVDGEKKRLDATVPEIGAGKITGQFGMVEEAGNTVLELTLFGSTNTDHPIASSFSTIRWKDRRRPCNIEGREVGYAETFSFSGLPPDSYSLRIALDPSNELWIYSVVDVRDGENVDLGFRAFSMEDFLQAKLGYVPNWADDYLQMTNKLDDSPSIGEVVTPSEFNDSTD